MKRPPTREAACTGKSNLSALDAKRVARRMRERGERVAEYRCIFCHGWHVGHPGAPKGERGRPVVQVED